MSAIHDVEFDMAELCGWHNDPEAVQSVAALQPFPSFGNTPANEISTLPKQAFLWNAAKKVLGTLLPWRNQGSIGSCVAHGTNRAILYSLLCEIASGSPEKYAAIAEEVTYGGSRVEIGRNRIRGDGSVGAWAAEFVRQYGVVARGKYGKYDLSVYSESTCRSFGDNGVPTELENVAKTHPVKTITKISTWEEAKKALAQGYGISVCSNQGFSKVRNQNGVAAPHGSWAHCMCLAGYITLDDGTEYGRIDNSWGPNYFSGPVGWGEPGPEGFWAQSKIIHKMLQYGDSWAFSTVEGFPLRLDWVI
jgi:hypothetical protein